MPRLDTNNLKWPAVIIPIVLLFVRSVIQSTQSVNAQNSTTSNGSGNGATVGNTNLNTSGNKTVIVMQAPAKSTSHGLNYNRIGFINLYNVAINGKPFPIKYNITGGKMVGIVADKDKEDDPCQKSANLTIELPRNVIDSKGASNDDPKFQVKIVGKGVNYKELSNNVNSRILSIDFSKDNRFEEIIGTLTAS